MSSEVFFDGILKYLIQYSDIISINNSLGLTDKALNAENIFLNILNLSFGWNLENANTEKSNQDSFDLYDKKAGIYVQITSNKNHNFKRKTSQESFLKNKSRKKIKFYILFITQKCKPSTLKEEVVGNINFEGIDIDKLVKMIYRSNTRPSDLEKINSLLQDAIEPVKLAFTYGKNYLLPNQLHQLSIELSNGLYIERTELIKEIFDFVQFDNGLLIGGHGYGKTFILGELQRFCEKKRVPCIIIRINELITGTDDDINEQLNVEKGWLGILSSYELPQEGKRGILLFDAYDTAKDSILKQTILKQIQKSINVLKLKWNILVSVRSFDASKSFQLREMFPIADLKHDVYCRHIEIPKLSSNELETVMQSNILFTPIFKRASAELKELLQIPYFLNILYQILLQDNKSSMKELAHIETEEQLLSFYWKTKVVESSNTDLFLYKFTTGLAHKESLIIDKNAILNESNGLVLDELISKGLITTTSLNDRKIGFSHNILLDYSLSKYVISEDVYKLIEFVKQYEKMPFIFRQAFVYFYDKLWREDQDLFWVHHRSIKNQETPLFRLFHQTIINYVIVESYKSTQELLPMFEGLDLINKGTYVNRLLGAIRFITRGSLREKDLKLFLFLSHEMHWSFMWEFGRQIYDIIILLEQSNNSDQVKWEIIAEISCNYYAYTLRERKISDSQKELIDRKSPYGIDILCKVFQYSKSNIKNLIDATLDFLNEDNFPIRPFLSLSDFVTHIFKYDQSYGCQIFRRLYKHHENSKKETNFGTALLPMRSTRSQDYSLIYFRLEKQYYTLLEFNPTKIICLGLELLNNYHSSDFNVFGKQPLKVNNIDTYFMIEDFIEDIIDEQDHGILSFGSNIFKWLTILIESNDVKSIGAYIDIFIREAHSCNLWRRFIKFLTRYPDKTFKYGFSLLCNDKILLCEDTSKEAGALLTAIWPYMDAAERKVLEKIILNLGFEEKGEAIVQYRNMVISRLLNCIPKNETVLIETNHFLSNNKPVENKPTFRGVVMADIVPQSEEDKMQYAGFNPENKRDITAFKTCQLIITFNETFTTPSKKPSKNDFEQIYPILARLSKKSETNKIGNERQRLTYDSIISKCICILTKSSIRFRKEHKIFFIHLFNYYLKEFPKQSLTINDGSLLMLPDSNVRPYIAKAVAAMLRKEKSDVLVEMMIIISQDNNPQVRLQYLNNASWFWYNRNQDFWNILNNRSNIELDEFCLMALVENMSHSNVISQNVEKIEEATHNLFPAFQNLEGRRAEEIIGRYVVLLLKLYLFHNSSVSKTIVDKSLQDTRFSKRLIISIVKTIDPHNSNATDIKENLLYDLLLSIIDFRFDSLQKKDLEKEDCTDDFTIIDYTVQQLYFTISVGRGRNVNKKIENFKVEEFFHKIKTLLDKITDRSFEIDSGFMFTNTGYYFMQLLNRVFSFDSAYVLSLAFKVVSCAAANGFTYDQMTLREIVKLTEKVLADHNGVLNDKESFRNLLIILDQFASSGWQEALELTWRLKEIS
ncbi:SMEK domain-containing protein [Chryseobacterium binzhouense]|uniref:SMEK domain-containing protein n=1 Tax=Chryseobacterium binzhouense TaxID=2593646 RepID=UPI00289A540D|nr:SMEK domain-containing protein [Chryseobacterium binzhouense]